MNKVETTLRYFANFIGVIFGHVDSDSYKNRAPLWVVIAMVMIGLVSILLLLLALYAVVAN